MKISDIDKNFAAAKAEIKDNTAFYTLPSSPIDLYGVFYSDEEKSFVRITDNKIANLNERIAYLNKNTAGGRVKFSTNSGTLTLKAEWNGLDKMNHMPLSGSASFTLLEETDGKTKFITNFIPDFTEEKGMIRTKGLPGDKMRSYILYLPLYNSVTSLVLGFDADADLQGGTPYRNIPPILYYGSSITQGGCASRPDNAYQALISKWNNVDFINLGFSGNAKGEPEMADYLAGIKCSVFVCDYDYNAPTPEHLKETHYPLYRAFRKKQPLTPVIFMTRPNYEQDEQDSAKRLEIVKQTYEKALSSGDKNVYFIPGNELFGEEDRERCFVDGCHPEDTGFYRMAKRLYGTLEKLI